MALRVERASAAAVELDYGLESGIEALVETAEMLGTGDAHLALHRNYALGVSLPVRSSDPFKAERAGAFAGFVTEGSRGRVL